MNKGAFLNASIGRKFIMSVTGLFLITFLLVHLSINLLLIVDDSGDLFNMGAHFMGTNPLIKIMEPILALGFLVHIVWSFIITLQNMKARPQKYDKTSQSINSSFASRNMLILGAMVLIFLGIHIYNFWYHIKIVQDLGHVTVEQAGVHVHMEDAYSLVAGLFKSSICYCILYILGGILLGLHVSHGFWSAIQTIGFNNDIWRKRLEVIAKIVAVIFAVGFSIIPLYFMIKF